MNLAIDNICLVTKGLYAPTIVHVHAGLIYWYLSTPSVTSSLPDTLEDIVGNYNNN